MTDDGGRVKKKMTKKYFMKFKFERLNIWNDAMDFSEEIYNITLKFPDDEKYNLITQIRRASDSIALNISEGSISQTNPEQKKFISYAVRSLAEVVTCLHKAKRREYILNDEFDKLYADSYKLMNMILAFKNKIK